MNNLSTLHPTEPIKAGQFWRTRSGRIAKVFSINSPLTDKGGRPTNFYRFFPITGRIGKGSRPVNWTDTGRVFSESIDDEDDLIERIPSKKQW